MIWTVMPKKFEGVDLVVNFRHSAMLNQNN